MYLFCTFLSHFGGKKHWQVSVLHTSEASPFKSIKFEIYHSKRHFSIGCIAEFLCTFVHFSLFFLYWIVSFGFLTATNSLSPADSWNLLRVVEISVSYMSFKTVVICGVVKPRYHLYKGKYKVKYRKFPEKFKKVTLKLQLTVKFKIYNQL